jgi:alanine-glyoxylate transaminase/serine-glyoxylate transaminase/serine-pyruvate transaminase
MAAPLLGHLDPRFLELMDEVKQKLRQVFGTGNRMTLPISGTGSAGIECGLANLVREGDRVVVGVAGVFGGRMMEMVRRLGGEPVPVEVPWGTPVPVERLAEEVRRKPTALLAVVHAETSTGVLQSLDGLAEAAHDQDALLMVDSVTSLGGLPVDVDSRGIDLCASGTQKCLSAPPGLAPLTVNEQAMERIRKRSTTVRSWYLDLNLLDAYWGEERVYHHTAPISMIYGLSVALDLVLEEGLEARFRRHRAGHERLRDGLARMGLQIMPAEEHRLPMLNAVKVPGGVDEKAIRGRLLEEWGIEIGGGLGPLAGKIWRVGLMGESNRPASIDLLLKALETLLGERRAD